MITSLAKWANLGRKCQQQTVSHCIHALKKQIMKEERFKFEFCKVSLGELGNDCYRSIMTNLLALKT
jgi:hypothetical protein